MQMKEARKGRSTPEMRAVARDEGLPLSRVIRGVAEGRIVIPHNPQRKERVHPKGIGEGLRVKVNANVGSSPDYVKVEEEVEKAKVAQEYGADTVMDLSIGGDLDLIRRRILREVSLPVGTVPIYQAGIEASKRGSLLDMTSDDMFNAIRRHAKDGVDFVTVHCGVTKEVVEKLGGKRVLGIVSRGGAFLSAWILKRGEENPLYKEFDYLLELASEFDLVLSLGDGLRPGSIGDASDYFQLYELMTLGRLVKRAREKGVQTMVEGPGHLPLDQVEWNVKLEKAVCGGAPFYVLGPVVTDVAPGYDHLVGAIGGAVAGMAGADFLCYVTPSEHLCLPSVEDVREGVIAMKIAAHVADVARGIDLERELEMGKARRDLDWEKQFKLSLYPERARKIRSERPPRVDPNTCSMCSKFCVIKFLGEVLQGKA
ncbi:MAG: phosphomethylpyrimidine synthase ThiC [Candidatus Hadarchaeales archaeon]